MENEELIRRQMERTRESLTAKLETLEEKVARSVTAVTDTVTDTVANVKETVHESVESVKEAVDVKAHVERHPWLMVGGSVLCGFLAGELLSGNRKQESQRPFTLTPTPPDMNGNGHATASDKPQGGSPSWLAAFEPEIRHLKSLAVGVALGTVREMLTREVPPHMAEQLRGIIDDITKKAGGDPMPSSDFEALHSAAPCNPSASEHEFAASNA